METRRTEEESSDFVYSASGQLVFQQIVCADAEDLRQLQIFSRSGMDCAPSHLETDCRVTFSFSASSSCDQPLFFRSWTTLSAKIISLHLTVLLPGPGALRGASSIPRPGGCAPPTGAGQCVNRWLAQAGGPWGKRRFQVRCTPAAAILAEHAQQAGGTAAPVLREPRPRCRSRPASAAEGTETGGLRQADRQK